jgi:hypothetical protein
MSNMAEAQRGKPLVNNPGNNGGTVTKQSSSSKKPLFKPSIFSDVAPGYPNKLFGEPFSNNNYDYGKKIHFGFAFSLGTLDYKVISNTDLIHQNNGGSYKYFVTSTSPSISLGVSAIMDVRINHAFSFRLQVGPTFGERTLSFYRDDDMSKPIVNMKMEAVILEMPLVLKYKAMRDGNFRPYMIAGLTPYSDISSFKNFNPNRDLYVAVNPFDVALSIGFGFDVYANYFKFSLEGKYVSGIFNAASKAKLQNFEQYPEAISRMYSRGFVISLIFE